LLQIQTASIGILADETYADKGVKISNDFWTFRLNPRLKAVYIIEKK